VLTQCGGPAAILENVRGHGAALVLRGLPAGTLVEAELADGRRLLREAGAQPSYFGACADDCRIATGGPAVVALSVRAPYADAQRFELAPPQAAASSSSLATAAGCGSEALDGRDDLVEREGRDPAEEQEGDQPALQRLPGEHVRLVHRHHEDQERHRHVGVVLRAARRERRVGGLGA
jgi:hypothetical protein